MKTKKNISVMPKFKINQRVERNKDGVLGTVKAKDIQHDGKVTVVKYLVDFGGGIDNWQVVTREDISSIPRPDGNKNTEVKFYRMVDGKVITMFACVENMTFYDGDDLDVYKVKYKILSIGHSVYNGTDEFDADFGIKIARHRCKKNPFTTMISKFGGEFSKETVIAIMDAKAKYIIDNIDRFYRPQE